MSDSTAGFELTSIDREACELRLSGDWAEGLGSADFNKLKAGLASHDPHHLLVDGSKLGRWDSILVSFLLQCYNHCRERKIQFDTQNMPAGVTKLLAVATAVDTYEAPEEPRQSWLASFHPAQLLGSAKASLTENFGFIGALATALLRLLSGKATTRFSDFRNFCYQAGPNAFGIISLTSVLVGMILAYLGAVQLQQFGAEIYVANLVMIGMLREMGVLMTAVVMAGRTGAAYAAQLGTMQTNEEIDAITTMGISPVEFLIVPRVLALVVIMPLLTIYANLLGIVGGGIVAGGMGISPLQYISQSESAISLTHIMVGLLKSVVFAVLIAVAGCRAGINSGRSSAAVGQAATAAVVTAIVYLIVADAAINIFFQQLGI